jgi:Zn2+/Cd2+-exporting ATPase
MTTSNSPNAPSLAELLTRERWLEIARTVVTGVVALLYWQAMVPLAALWRAIALGLYPLVTTRLISLVNEHEVGTEIFVTIATLVAVSGGETVAGAIGW